MPASTPQGRRLRRKGALRAHCVSRSDPTGAAQARTGRALVMMLMLRALAALLRAIPATRPVRPRLRAARHGMGTAEARATWKHRAQADSLGASCRYGWPLVPRTLITAASRRPLPSPAGSDASPGRRRPVADVATRPYVGSCLSEPAARGSVLPSALVAAARAVPGTDMHRCGPGRRRCGDLRPSRRLQPRTCMPMVLGKSVRLVVGGRRPGCFAAAELARHSSTTCRCLPAACVAQRQEQLLQRPTYLAGPPW